MAVAVTWSLPARDGVQDFRLQASAFTLPPSHFRLLTSAFRLPPSAFILLPSAPATPAPVISILTGHTTSKEAKAKSTTPGRQGRKKCRPLLSRMTRIDNEVNKAIPVSTVNPVGP